jgi:methyltransferase-like protein
MLVANLSKQGPNLNRRQLHALRKLAESDSGEQLIELVLQPIDGTLAGL